MRNLPADMRADHASITDVSATLKMFSDDGLTTKDLLETRIDQAPNFRVRKSIVDLWMSKSEILTNVQAQIREATLGGSSVFYPTDWCRYFGIRFGYRTMDEAARTLPWTMDDINLRANYVLFWIPPYIPIDWMRGEAKDRPFTLRNLLKVGEGLKWNMTRKGNPYIVLEETEFSIPGEILDEELGGWHFLVRRVNRRVFGNSLEEKMKEVEPYEELASPAEEAMKCWLYMVKNYPQRIDAYGEPEFSSCWEYRICSGLYPCASGQETHCIVGLRQTEVLINQNKEIAAQIKMIPRGSELAQLSGISLRRKIIKH